MPNSRHWHSLCAVLVVASLPITPVGAQTIVLGRFDVTADPIVSGTDVDAFAQQATTVGPDQLTALNAQDIASALRRTPGVAITRYNVIGAFGGGEGGAILLRGLGSSRPGGEIKTTIDGVPKYNAIFNHPLLDLVSVDSAAAIEVNRRAEPTAAGNMFAGINLVSPRATQAGSFARGTLSAGSFGSFTEKTEVGTKTGAYDAYIGQSFRRADGHRPDSDGRLANDLVHLGWQPDAHWDIHYLLNRTDNRATDPGPLGATGLAQTKGDVYQTSDWLHLLTAAWKFDRASGSLKLYQDDGQANWLRRASSGNADSLNDYRLSGVRWRETTQPWTGADWVFGADYDLSRGTSSSIPVGGAPVAVFGPTTFRLFSAYAGIAQTFATPAGWSITPSSGVRYYDHRQFGATTAPQVGLVAREGGTQLHASFSRAINFPGLDVAAFSALVIPPLAASWPALRPEKLDQFELGWRQEVTAAVAIDLTLFRNRGRDRYVWQTPPPRYLNIEHLQTQGGEFTLTARPTKTLSVFGGISRLETDPNDVPYAPRWSAVGGLTWIAVPRLTLNVDTSYTGTQHTGAQGRTLNTPNPETVGAAMLLNARVGFSVLKDPSGRHVQLFVAGENLLDRRYAYRPGYPMPGVSYSGGITVGF
jgi:outer membrane cobalamin receptor